MRSYRTILGGSAGDIPLAPGDYLDSPWKAETESHGEGTGKYGSLVTAIHLEVGAATLRFVSHVVLYTHRTAILKKRLCILLLKLM